MIIAQIVLDDASEYERKCQRIDAEGLAAAGHTISLDPAAADIVHVYAGRTLPALELKRPFVANVAPRQRKFSLRRVANPAAIVTPFNVPEAVEDYFVEDSGGQASSPATAGRLARRDGLGEAADPARRGRLAVAGGTPALHKPPMTSGEYFIGSYARPSTQAMIEQTMHRIDRFRDDIAWRLFSHSPSPEEIASHRVWIDPAVDDDDYDGFVAEALACGVNVVATGTPVNVQRLEKGRTGFVVPPRDPNEMTHAILTALFKPETARARAEAARRTIAKFKAGGRIRALTRIYESIVPSNRH